ncbi:hypothetical protein Pedsa_0058 [Pseudopedobacter saltans DSM 12145]|uniref:Secretion system C-terminal sorting domain-containing protein n=1 Tax=Pseudopedobacter saltans (strain ATCC 51119 / DSM 12145 / JCM 21818 / CCUG 39354 / LMG 10337 / NBRC 100064 / NCIMB 13643) TaxID=762903 RepID=F0SC61_PSESL|nr:T9SS type A sorting domain-containing protein [Pseudopedobacter saltans]ADY50646.1 hypothetical protein Pedsa_0058 [Pseudopedobacter saltans DSM 12145]
MKKTLRTSLILMLAAGAVQAQFSPYSYTVNVNLNRGVGNDSTANGVNSKWYESPNPVTANIQGRFFPNITDGAYKLRAISYQTDAQFTLSGEKLTIKNSTSGLAKVSAYNIQNASAIAKFSFDLDLTDYTGIKEFVFAFGTAMMPNTLINTSSTTSAPTADIFGSFRIVKSGNLVTQYRNSDGTSNLNTASYLIKAGESQRVEIFVNSSASDIIYSYGISEAPVTLLANTYHVYVKGVRYAEGFPKVGTAYVQPTINTLSFAYASAGSGGTPEKVSISNISVTYQSETNLPVSLTSFNAAKTQNGVQLKWQTASEQNNQYFDVLRSVNGKDFVSIGIVNGAGTTSEARSYFFIDHSPVSGYNYYKLKQVDGDGKSTVYENRVQSVNWGFSEDNVSAYFSADKLIVQFNSDNAGEGNIKLVTVGGKQVFLKKVNVTRGNNEFVCEATGTVSGIYLVKVNTGENVKNMKIIK